MKLLLVLTTLLLTTLLLKVFGSQRSSALHGHFYKGSCMNRTGDGSEQQVVVPNAAKAAEDNKHEEQLAMDTMVSNARRRLAAAVSHVSTSKDHHDEDGGGDGDGDDIAEMKRRVLPSASPQQDQAIAALLHALDNMDGQDARPASMMVVTAGQMDGHDECNSSLGAHLLTKDYKNKVDYCNVQGCTVRYLLERVPAAKDMGGASPPHLMLPLMRSHPSVQWFLWMPAFSLFTNMSSSFPLHTYRTLGKHLILLPTSSSPPPVSLEALMENQTPMDPLMFLVQNSEWSRDLLAEWGAMMSTMGAPTGSTEMLRTKQMISKSLQIEAHVENKDDMNYDGSFKKKVTSSLFQVLRKRRRKQNGGEVQGKVHVETGLYLHGEQGFLVKSYENLNSISKEVLTIDGIQAYQKKIGLLLQNVQNRAPLASKVSPIWPFMVHFEGCDFCDAPSIHELCLSTFQRAFHYGDNQLLGLASMQHHHLYSTLVY